MKVVREEKNQIVSIRLGGPIDEDASFQNLRVDKGKNVLLDMGDIEYINSCGAREWVKWINHIDPASQVAFVNCSTVFLDYVNMIDGFVPKQGKIESFKVPYYCEKCDLITSKMYETSTVKDLTKDIPSTVPCIKCGSNAEIDVIIPNFFRFLAIGKKP